MGKGEEKVKSDPRVKMLIQYFGEIFALNFEDSQYLPVWGRDGKLIKDLLKGILDVAKAESKIKEAVEFYLSTDNQFQGNCDIPSFFKQFNRIQAHMAKIKKWDRI